MWLSCIHWPAPVLAMPTIKRAVDRVGQRDADVGQRAGRPFGIGHGRAGRRRARPILAPRGRRVGIGGRRILAPFQLVVIGDALQNPVAQIAVEAGVILVRIALRGFGGSGKTNNPGGQSGRDRNLAKHVSLYESVRLESTVAEMERKDRYGFAQRKCKGGVRAFCDQIDASGRKMLQARAAPERHKSSLLCASCKL